MVGEADLPEGEGGGETFDFGDDPPEGQDQEVQEGENGEGEEQVEEQAEGEDDGRLFLPGGEDDRDAGSP